MCGEDMDVPEYGAKAGLPRSSLIAARIPTPGAVMSGLMVSPPSTSSEAPRELNPATCGAGRSTPVVLPSVRVTVAPAFAA